MRDRLTDLFRSGCDLGLAGESAEDRSAAHVVVGEVDHGWRLGFGLGRDEVRQRPMWAIR